MRKKGFITSIVVLLIFAIVFPAISANTVVRSNKFICITPDGSTDWDLGEDQQVIRITFVPSAATDVLVVRHGTAAGVPTVYLVISTKDSTNVDFGHGGNQPIWRPYIKASDCTFGTAGNVRILIEYQ